MGVVVDVILAVAVVAVAAGAVTEFQLRVAHVCPSADGAFVGVGGFYRGVTCLVRAGRGEGDHIGGAFLFALFALKEPGGVGLPRDGNEIDRIFSKEQEIVGKGDQGEEVDGEKGNGDANDLNKGHHQIKEGKDPSLYRDNKEQQKLGVGVKGGVGNK